MGGSCILILTVTTFHSNIRHRPTKVSVQAAKNYKWIIVYFLANYLSLTTWPIFISVRNIISISVYFLGLLLFFGFGWVFFVWFQKFTLMQFLITQLYKNVGFIGITDFSLNEQAFIQDFTCSKCFNIELQIVKLSVFFIFM